MNHFQGDTAALRAFAGERQDTRLLRLRFPNDDAPAGVFMLANTLEADEGLGRDFVLTVGVLSDSATILHEDVLAKMVCIDLVREDATLRYFNGYVTGFRLLRTDGGFVFYEMTVEPWMAFLRLRHNNAAFHDLNGIDITGRIVEQYLKHDWRHRLTGRDAEVTYTCQYGESDHNFLHRQWEARGWFTSYEHRADGHTLVLADDSTCAAAPIAGARTDIPWQHQAGSMEDDGIHRWSAAQSVCSDRTTLVSFNFKHPLPVRVERHGAAGVSSSTPAEVYENTGMYGFRTFDDGEVLSQLRMEEIEARRREYTATGNDRSAEPGRWFTLSGYAGAGTVDPQQKYLITAVRHHAANNYQDGRGAVPHYANDITCIVQTIPWRPGRGFHSVTPRIDGVQTAVVVGPPGEEIHTDGHGRIKIQFHWDRIGKFNDRSSPWVRVVSSWAGAQFGHISLPRVGMEVAVQFLDGDVNRPLVIGCVYNANNMPPWELPANKTQSGILTRSSKAGRSAHANALRFEDKRGVEEVWLHAEKDQRIEVEHDELHWVGNDRRKTVDHDEVVVVKHDQNVTVNNNRTERVDHNETVSIGDNRAVDIGGHKKEHIALTKDERIGLGKTLTIGAVYQTTVGGAMNTTVALAQFEEVGASKTVLVGDSSSLTAGTRHTMTVGSSSITITDGRIELVADEIVIRGRKKVQIHGDDIDNNPG
jgi:type VI secretion system secreted protein VgrG